MSSRQDQLHSYQFAVQRVVAALVMRETDPARSPFRRAAGATLASALIAAIALGGVAVYGVFTSAGSTRWRAENALVVEQDSGARFVYVKGKLHPVLNYTSALLIAGSPGKKPVRVSRKSIAGVPRGNPLGIADAPDPLPVRGALAAYPWTVCSAIAPGAGPAPRSTLLVGAGPSGGTALGDKGVLVEGPGGDIHLIWNNRRHRLREPDFVRSALGWSGQSSLPISPALVNSVPSGADLEPITIPDRGDRFSFVPDAKVGEVFIVKGQGGGRDQYAVALRGGLATITEVQLRLILADPETRTKLGQDQPTELALSDFAAIPKLDDLKQAGLAPPASTPELATVDTGALCAVIRDDGGVAEVRAQAAVPDTSTAMPGGARSARGAVQADYVRVEPGKGAVVEAVSSPGAQGGTLCVVTDMGRRYSVPNAEVLDSLGLRVAPVRVPANVVALLPAGPALDPKAARDPAGQG